jgi:hypothetical protein
MGNAFSSSIFAGVVYPSPDRPGVGYRRSAATPKRSHRRDKGDAEAFPDRPGKGLQSPQRG